MISLEPPKREFFSMAGVPVSTVLYSVNHQLRSTEFFFRFGCDAAAGAIGDTAGSAIAKPASTDSAVSEPVVSGPALSGPVVSKPGAESEEEQTGRRVKRPPVLCAAEFSDPRKFREPASALQQREVQGRGERLIRLCPNPVVRVSGWDQPSGGQRTRIRARGRRIWQALRCVPCRRHD